MIVCFYPDMPSKSNKVWNICKGLNFRMTNDPSKDHDLLIRWDIDTIAKKDVWEALPKHIKDTAINGLIEDVSKSYVDSCFEEAFGYSSLVNPKTHKGRCVEKSEKQYAHDGMIRQCPLEPKPGKVYQKLIDTRQSPNILRDYRVNIMGDQIVSVTIKEIDMAKMFGIQHEGILKYANQVFDFATIKKIQKFCDIFCLDFGELDMLQDADGKWYIIDVNNCAGNGGFKMMKTATDASHLQQLNLESFKHQFLK